PQAREAQRRLAAEMTTLVHGQANTDAVELASKALFGRAELTDLDESTLAAALKEASIAEVAGDAPRTIVDLLVASGLSESKGAARRAVKEGGAYVNNQRVESDDWTPESSDLLHGRWLVIRRGRKNFAGIKVIAG
ncbi:tyrosine--tRNA ligase, partial [Rhodococcus hoagii]|nr:tyrosine--tRNA ligase [Prescottella equi]